MDTPPVHYCDGCHCSPCVCHDYDDSECGNCGGEGFTYGCSWDWQCDTWDGDNCLCTRRCEWCQPLTAAEITERNKLRDIMATALAKDKIAEMRSPSPPDPPSASTASPPAR